MKKLFLISGFFLLLIPGSQAFCGFFVCKADAKLFNRSSQVIMVRNGNRSVITMSNDFQGNVKDFAMVVPVPVVLKNTQIRTVAQHIFDKVDAYSAPRVAKYYDHNPCAPVVMEDMDYLRFAPVVELSANASDRKEKYKGVKIEARYEVDEYDILILSATQSGGLKRWLTDNGYKIPEKAEEVLDPYIKNRLKFFVAKVNLERHAQGQVQQLSPLQIEFNSDRFMLPIRLGMANANGDQDLIIHAYTDKGRVECTNYRTIKMPHDVNVPEFVADTFGHFYKATFDRMYRKAGGKGVFLEYAWDVSPRNAVKCDPCVGTPPINQNLVTAGCNWISNPAATVQYTRLHVRYNRRNFPQDLFFQITPNRERFQCRYVITHPAQGDLNCSAGREYLKTLIIKREDELNQLALLTGWNASEYPDYVGRYKKMLQPFEEEEDKRNGYELNLDLEIQEDKAKVGGGVVYWWLAGTVLVFLTFFRGIFRSVRF